MRQKNSPSVDNIREFVLENGSKMSNKKMSKQLRVKQIRIAGCVAALKRTKIIDNNYLFDDKVKNGTAEPVRRGRPSGSKNTAVSVAKKHTPDVFNNYDGKRKLEARNVIIRAIRNSGIIDGKIISLPADQCILELKIKNEVSPYFNFELVEYIPNTFIGMVETMLKEKLNVCAMHNCDISEVISKAKENEFSHMLLDYCDSLNRIYRDVADAMTRKLVKVGGIIEVTFCQRYCKSEIIENLNKYGKPDGVTKTMHAVQKFVEKFEGFEIVETFPYKDGAPMMLVIIKRTK